MRKGVSEWVRERGGWERERKGEREGGREIHLDASLLANACAALLVTRGAASNPLPHLDSLALTQAYSGRTHLMPRGGSRHPAASLLFRAARQMSLQAAR